MVLEELNMQIKMCMKTFDPFFTPYVEISLKQIIELYVNAKITKLQEDVDETLCNTGGRQRFLSRIEMPTL